MTGRELRPAAEENVRNPSDHDEISGRGNMEASENTAPSRRRGGGPPLHRIDPYRVAGTLATGGNADGLARLNLMVSTIFERLVADSGESRR
jgi:hypothetical protein